MSKAPATTSRSTAAKLDRARWWLASALFIAAVIAYYWFDQFPSYWRVLALSVVGVVCVVLVYTTQRGLNLRTSAHDARVEIRKVVWPGRPEVLQGTVMILIVVVILSLLLWGMDSLFGWIITLFLG